MIFRLAHKLNSKIKTGTLNELPLDENPYSDWSCHLFTANRAQYILLTNTKSLYSCVMPGKGMTSESTFVDRALSTLRDFMDTDGQAFAYQKFVAPDATSVRFGKALNRSVTGSMNELIYFAKLWLIEDGLPSCEVGFKLNDIPMSALKEVFAKDAFKKLADDL